MSPPQQLIILPGSGGEKGIQEADLNASVVNWNYQTKLGIVFSSSTIFRLPNNAKCSPDFA
ncbi:Uma2 family endonuclease [Anabaena sp. UHCC 0451]|uniref:Uma2 family endonuclease n=1 Tax=Anabaena sp. UHCC 0451 TaxID=2055235 RepID=UPI003A4C7B92